MDELAFQEPSVRESSLAAYRDRLTRALAYVQQNLGGEISLEAAAAVACFSKFHFHRIFSAALGEGFADYVRRLRLARAANFLEFHPRMSMTEIALESGFSSSAVFSRLFSERFGQSPTRWKRERLAAARAASRAALSSRRGSGLPSFWEGGAAALSEAASSRSPVSVRKLPAFRFASCLHVGAYGPGIGEAWTRLFHWAGPRGLLNGPLRSAGLSWDNPDFCPAESCRYSACLEIPETVETSGDVVLLLLPPRTYLCLRFEGSETEFAAAYADLYRRLLPESGFEPEDAPAVEFYLSFPAEEGRFDVDIALPVRPLS